MYQHFPAIFSEARKETLRDSEGQVLAQMAASREQYIRSQDGSKRKVTELDAILEVNTCIPSMLISHPPQFKFVLHEAQLHI